MRVTTIAICLLCALFITVTSTFAQGTPPSPPTLQYPASGASDIPTYIEFSWSSSAGATSYDLQVSLSPLFDDFTVNETGLTDHSFVPWKLFADGTTYYWRVRAVGPDGYSRWEPSVGGQPFATAQESIEPPNLLLPEENARGVSPMVEFSWSAAKGAKAYDFQLSASSLFLVTLADIPDHPDTVLSLPTPLPIGTAYYWRVRSTGAAGKSVWSPVMGGRTFAVGSGVLESPTLISPAKDAQGVSTLTGFSWSAVPGATSYQLLVTDEPLVGNIVVNVQGITSTSYTIAAPLDNSTTYYWRVLAVDEVEGSTSLPPTSGQAFTTLASVVGVPTLIVPANGATDLSRQPTFRWTAVTGATSYEILITSSQFLGGSEYRKAGIVDTSFVPPPDALNAGVAYSWFVRAQGVTGNGPWAPGQTGWTFSTRLAPPSQPLLNSPANGDTGLTRAILLSWWNNTDSTATAYHVQVALDATFQHPVVDRSNVTGTEIVVTLSLSTQYHWRVLARNPEGESIWSEVWSFSTGAHTLLPPVLVSPKENAEFVPTRPTFTWESAPGAESYDLQVYAPTGLSTWFLEMTIDKTGITGTTFKPASPLRKGTTYAWRARSVSAADTSLWSPMLTSRLFTTVPSAPPAPALVSPEHEASGLGLTPTVCWEPVPEARYYWVEIATDPGFRSIVGSYCEVDPPCLALSDQLSPNTVYYWRVSAKNDGGWGPHSSVHSFTTANLAAEPPFIVQHPSNEHVQVGQTGTFAVLARGTGPLSYQWQKNAVDIPGATSPWFTAGPAKPADDGSLFSCTVTNAQGTAASSAARLTISQTAVNLVGNCDFEAGTASWEFFTDGVADFSADGPGMGSAHAGTIKIIAEGVNQQLYQAGLRLEPATYYRLRFNARADHGGFISTSLMKHGCPNTSFGLDVETFAITPFWQSYSVEFPTSGFVSIVRDARLAFKPGAPHVAGDRYQLDDVVLEKIYTKERSDTVVMNAGFENGVAPWEFVTSGQGTMTGDAAGDGSPHAALIRITDPGKNTQMYQAGLMAIPDAVYQLTFKAYCTTGNDVAVIFHRDDAPFTNYGLNKVFDLSTSWKTFSVRFVSPDIPMLSNSGRLRFWFPRHAEAADEYVFDDIVLERIRSSSVADGGSLISNPGFESGTAPWWFHSDTEGSFDDSAPGDSSEHAAVVRIDAAGTNVQLSQSAIALRPGTMYRLSFKAYSSTGHDVGLALHQDGPPYTIYGLEVADVDLSTEWKTFTTLFKTTGFQAPIGDARLKISFGGYATAGDRYFFDDFTLEPAPSAQPAVRMTADAGGMSGTDIPENFILGKCYPNPFNPTTWISFGVPEPSEVSLKVFDLVGQEITTLFEGTATAGYHRVQWNAQSQSGRVSSGVYFYRFIGRGASGRVHTQIEKMILLR